MKSGASVASIERTLAYALSETRNALKLIAAHDDGVIDDYATTLLVAVLTPEFASIAQIGDGAVVIDDGVTGWRPVHWPDHGEYANTTSFLTQIDALDVMQITTFDRPVQKLAMFSDGLERLVLDFNNRGAHGPFFDSIFKRFAPTDGASHHRQISDEIENLLASDAVNARTDDDKSLVCAQLVVEA